MQISIKEQIERAKTINEMYDLALLIGSGEGLDLPDGEREALYEAWFAKHAKLNSLHSQDGGGEPK